MQREHAVRTLENELTKDFIKIAVYIIIGKLAILDELLWTFSHQNIKASDVWKLIVDMHHEAYLLFPSASSKRQTPQNKIS